MQSNSTFHQLKTKTCSEDIMIQIKPLHQQYFLILLLVTLLGFSSILIFGAGTRRKNGARVSPSSAHYFQGPGTKPSERVGPKSWADLGNKNEHASITSNRRKHGRRARF